jgi:hypothetical protein
MSGWHRRTLCGCGQAPAQAGPKAAHASTWVWGTTDTIVVIAMMVIGYRVSARLAQRRTATTSPAPAPAIASAPATVTEATGSAHGDLVEA